MDANVGRRIGRFQLIELLGRGGFASVYRAEDTELGRQVAIKLLHSGLARDDAFVRRFRAEARAAAGLRHPNIVALHEVGTTDDGQTYLVMELLQGTLLSQLVRGQKPLPPDQAGTIVTQLAAALDHLHSRGLVHRDLKPANVMVDERGEAILMDFGIARTFEDEAHLTQTGQVVGTPVYMAPEQITGGPITAAADVYALGVLAYELLAGRPPFLGTPTGIIHDQIYSPPPPIAEINAKLPASISHALDAALAKHPSARPATAGAFAALLTGTTPTVLTTPNLSPDATVITPVHSAGETQPSPVSAYARRSRVRIAVLVGVVTLLLLGGMGALLLTGGSSSKRSSRQIAAKQAASATAVAATGVVAAVAATPVPSASPGSVATAPPPTASASPAPAGSATIAPTPPAGLPPNITIVADDDASATAVAPAQQDVAQLVQQFGKDYGLVANRPFQIELASVPEATKAHLMSDLGLTASAADAFFQQSAGFQFNTVGSSLRVLVYLPNSPDLHGSLAYTLADYTLRSVGAGFEQVDAYPYWFLRGFLGYAYVRFGAGDAYRPRAVQDARTGKSPSLASVSKSADAMTFMGSSSSNSATFLAWSEATDAYIAKTYGDASLGQLLTQNAFGTIDKFNQLLQSITGMTLDQFNNAVIASLTQ